MVDPTYRFREGFDKYGPVGLFMEDRIVQGDWTTVYQGSLGASGVDWYTIPALSGDLGAAIECNTSVFGDATWLYKTLPGRFNRCIGGVVTRSNLANRNVGFGVLLDGNYHCTWTMNHTTGRLTLRIGGFGGGAIGVCNEFVLQNEINTIEWDILIGNGDGHFKLWLNGDACTIDGVVGGLTGIDNTTLGTEKIDGIAFGTHGDPAGMPVVFAFDHIYCDFYAGDGDGSETPCLTNPIIETSLPESEVSTDFLLGAAILGRAHYFYWGAAGTNLGANTLQLQKETPVVDAQLDAVTFMPRSSSLTAKLKPVVYSDVGGVPTSLLSVGTEAIGFSAGTLRDLDLSTPVAITAGQPVWIGFITDSAVNIQQHGTGVTRQLAANPYGSGAPNPAPGMTVNQSTLMMFGRLSDIDERYSQVNFAPPGYELSFNVSGTVGDRDVVHMAPLQTNPIIIYDSTIKAFAARTDAGARFFDLETISNAVISAGDNTYIAPPASFRYIESCFPVDPDTGVAWTLSGINASDNAYKIAG